MTLGIEEGGLFEIEAPPPVTLADRFGVPPFSILDRRSGAWKDRKRRWLSMGIRSELGRDGGLIYDPEGSGMGQGALPMGVRTDQSLRAAAQGYGADAKRAQRELDERDAREALGEPRVVQAGLRKAALTNMRPPSAAEKTQGGHVPTEGPDYWIGEEAKRVSTGAPVPGGGSGTGGAWFGRKADGEAGYFDPKWDTAAQRRRLNEAGAHRDQDKLNAITGQETLNGTSVFDPVLCELAYRWFCPEGGRVLDPFAGGSVRGITAAVLGRQYMGVDLRDAQIVANREQGRELLTRGEPMPKWVAGDSAEVLQGAPKSAFDFVFSCPPYADLEVYSDDPRDISGMSYPEFCRVHGDIIRLACGALRPDRFAAWVISDVRDERGHYRGLVHETVRAFEAAGLSYYNEAVILDPVGSAAVRAARIFVGGRKLIRMHQVMLVFVKGSWKRAAEQLKPEPVVVDVEEG